jgi:hypothetical protein
MNLTFSSTQNIVQGLLIKNKKISSYQSNSAVCGVMRLAIWLVRDQ